MSFRKAAVYVRQTQAGILEETETGYVFTYNSDYLSLPDADPVSLTFPFQDKPFESSVLFPFFDGLIPEGWLLDIVEETWKVNPRDRMGLLLVSCHDTIGHVSVREI